MSNISVPTPAVFTLIGFFSIALLFTSDHDGGVDLLDATIDYVRAVAHEVKE